jgi:hypothetical protein
LDGSTDLKTWTDTGVVISKAMLDGTGGTIETQDLAALANPPPSKFYRIVIP